MHGNSKNLLHQTFGQLTVIERSSEKSKQGVLWVCQCSCGRLITLPTKQLTSGHRTSCGHHQIEHLDAAHKKLESHVVNGTKLAYFNDKPSKNSSTGIRGVSPYETKSGTRYTAFLEVKGHKYRKGGFLTVEAAQEYRKQLETEYLPEKL